MSGNSSAATARYSSFLVLGVTENYTHRAYYEREVARQIRQLGAAATPYHEAAGGNTPLDRDAIRQVMLAGDYDALFVTRVLAQSSDVSIHEDQASAKAVRRTGRPFDLFRYDYEEFDAPGTLDIKSDVTVAGEIYAAADERMVWSAEVTNSGAENVGELIDAVADRMVRQLDRGGLVAR